MPESSLPGRSTPDRDRDRERGHGEGRDGRKRAGEDRQAKRLGRTAGPHPNDSGGPPRRGDPLAASDLVRGLLKDLRKQGSRLSLTHALVESLGREQAAHCHVVGFRNGRLVVEVDSAPLFAELSSFRREELRLAINERLPVPKVAQLTFRMGGTGHV